MPADSPELRASFRFDRFTELSKTRTRYNEIDETAGFNIFGLSYSDNTPWDPDLVFTVTGGVGFSADQPTRFLQNDYIHKVMHFQGVPVDGTRDDVEYAASGSLTKWFDGPRLFGGEGPDDNSWRTRFCLGGGVATSTIYHEAFAHAGGTLFVPDVVFGSGLRFGLIDRFSVPEGGGSYADLAEVSNLTQVSIGLVPRSVHAASWFGEALGNPEVGVTVTYDTGFFRRRGEPLDTWFAGFYAEWGTGLRLETWNDIANHTDYGPTYGLLISVDVFTCISNWWRW